MAFAVFDGGLGVGADDLEASVAEHVGHGEEVGAAAEEGGREGYLYLIL
jgi:hypothetical protein